MDVGRVFFYTRQVGLVRLHTLLDIVEVGDDINDIIEVRSLHSNQRVARVIVVSIVDDTYAVTLLAAGILFILINQRGLTLIAEHDLIDLTHIVVVCARSLSFLTGKTLLGIVLSILDGLVEALQQLQRVQVSLLDLNGIDTLCQLRCQLSELSSDSGVANQLTGTLSSIGLCHNLLEGIHDRALRIILRFSNVYTVSTTRNVSYILSVRRCSTTNSTQLGIVPRLS